MLVCEEQADDLHLNPENTEAAWEDACRTIGVLVG